MSDQPKTDLELRNEGYILAREACELLGVSRVKFWRMVDNREIDSPPYKQSDRRHWFLREEVERAQRMRDFEADRRKDHTVSIREFAKRLGWSTDEVRRAFREQAVRVSHKLLWAEGFVRQIVAEFDSTLYIVSGETIRKAILAVDPALGWLYRVLLDPAENSVFDLDTQRRGKRIFFTRKASESAMALAQDLRPINEVEFCKMLGGLTNSQFEALQSLRAKEFKDGFPKRVDSRRLRKLRGQHWHYGEAKRYALRFLECPERILRPTVSASMWEWLGQKKDGPRPVPDSNLESLDLRYLAGLFDRSKPDPVD